MWPVSFSSDAWRRVAFAALTLVVVTASVVVVGDALRTPPRSGCCSKHSRARTIVKAVEQGLVAYRAEHANACAPDLATLYTQKYLAKSPTDPWGEPLLYRCPGAHDQDGADVWSKGEDGRSGTPDDVESWER